MSIVSKGAASPRRSALAGLIAGAIVQMSAAHAQTAPDANPQQGLMPAVTVTAPRVRSGGEPGPSTVLGASDIASKTAATSDTAGLLADIPGISLMGAGGVSSLPALDGLADDRLHTEVDGIDLMAACANHMNPPLSYIDPTAVGRIEVYPAVAPVSLGGDSIGGTIVVESLPPEFAQPGQGLLKKGQVGGFYRSNGDAAGGNLAATLAGPNLSVWYRGSVARSGNYTAADTFRPAGPAFASNPSVPGQAIPWLAGDEVGSTAYKAENQQLGLALRRGNHTVDLEVDRQRIPYQGFPNQRMDMTRNDATLATLRYRGRFDWGSLQARLFHQNTEHSMDFGDDKQFYYGSASAILAPGMPMETHGKNTGAKVDAAIDLSQRDVLKLGGTYQHFGYDEWWPPSPSVLPPGVTMGGMAPNDFWNIRDGRRDRLGAYAEWLARWNQRWTSDVGLRVDRVDMNAGPVQGYNNGPMYNGAPLFPATTFNSRDHRRTDTNWDFSALLHYAPGAGQTYSIGVAQKTRSPNLYERYAWSPNRMAMEMIGWFGDGNYYIGNLDLRPERARTLSFTADWHDADRALWGVKITPYYTHVDDYIDVRRCPTTVCTAMPTSVPVVTANLTATTGFVMLQFVNQSARLYGVDLSAHALLATNPRFGNLTVKGVLGYVDGKNTTTGDRLYDMMPLNARLALVQQVGNWTNTIEEQLVSAKTQVSAVRNELRTGGYALLNLRTGYAWKGGRFDLGVLNALNKFYALPLGGAYVGQGATMSGGAIPWGIPVPGMGRSFYAGATLYF